MPFGQPFLFQEVTALSFQLLRPWNLAMELGPLFLYVPSPSYSAPSENSWGSIFKMSVVSDNILLLLPHLYVVCPCTQIKFGGTVVMEEKENMDLYTDRALK